MMPRRKKKHKKNAWILPFMDAGALQLDVLSQQVKDLARDVLVLSEELKTEGQHRGG